MKRIMLSIVASLSLLGGGATQAQDTVKVGAVLSLSGPAGAFGVAERDAIDLLVKKHNSNADADTPRYEVVFYDDQTNPTEAARGATKLIEQDNVVALIGATTGSGALALMPVAAKAEVPVLSQQSTIGLTSPDRDFYPWIFRTMPGDDVMMRKQFEHVVLKPGHKRMAIFHQEDAFGKFGADFLVGVAKEHGVEIVAMTSAPASAVDVTAGAIRIRNSRPDIVMLQVNSPALGAAFMRAGAQVGLDAVVAGSGGLNQRAFFELVGESGDGLLLTGFGNWNAPSDRLKGLKQVIVEGGKQPTGFGEIRGGASFAILVEAVRRIDGPITGPAIRDSIESLCGFETYYEGQICFSPTDHDGVSGDAMINMVFKDGQLQVDER